MPPEAIIWLAGTISVAAMGGISAISVAMIRRSSNGLVTKGDFNEFRSELKENLRDIKDDVKAVDVKLDTHITYSHFGYRQEG